MSVREGEKFPEIALPSKRIKRATSARDTRLPAVTVDPSQLALMLEQAVRAGAAPKVATVTLADHWSWWKPRFLSRLVAGRDYEQRIRDHLLPGCGELTEDTLTPDAIELHLTSLEGKIAPGTINHVRAHGRKVINDAIRARRWRSPNPFAQVHKRKVPKRQPYIPGLREVRRMIGLAAPDIAVRWVALLGLGMRLGEMRGLRVEDYDRANARLGVHRSGTRDTTKTGRARVIPLPPWILPFLDEALSMTRCAWLFPSRGGLGQLSKGCKPGKLLDRALRRAGVVEAWEHKCRKRGCVFIERHPLNEMRWCPEHSRALQCRGIPRKLRVHDLRHVMISLAQEAGVHPGVVAVVAGHSQKSVTQSVYTHFREDFIRVELNKLDLTPIEEDLAGTMAPRASKSNVPGSSPGWRAKSKGQGKRGNVSAPPSAPSLLTSQDVAERLGCDVSTVRSLIHNKRLIAVNWGREYRVTEDDLAAFIDAHRGVSP